MSERSLVKKMAQVMAEVERVAKNGTNSFHKYDYATEADIVSAVRGALAARNVAVLPRFEPIGTRTTDKGEVVTVLKLHLGFLDGDSGEDLTSTVISEGSDKSDKGAYKAMTGAIKYALLKTFLIPTGDDPELDNEKPKVSQAVAAPVAKPKPAANSDFEKVKAKLEEAKSKGENPKGLVADIKKLGQAEQDELRPLYQEVLAAAK